MTKRRTRVYVGLTAALALAMSLLAFPAANATGWTSRNCSTWGLGSGTVEGFSGTAYAYTQKNNPCAGGVSVQIYYQVYPGGPYAWTGVTAGIAFARRDQVGTVNAEHCIQGVACFPT